MNNRYSFIGGRRGPWRVTAMHPVVGEALATVERLDVVNGAVAAPPSESAWILQSFVSNVRYANRDEIALLRSVQPGLNRQEAATAVLIPIKKTAEWWALAQDERRAIFEEESHHTAVGVEYLPAVARQLHHCRDLGEPFDFLTWFEFAPEHAAAFSDLLSRMRASRE
jgi:chlorite dismutase